MRRRSWTLDAVSVERRGGAASRAAWLGGATAQAVARALYGRGVRRAAVRDRAYSRHYGLLESRVAAAPADVVIAHNLQALPAAARAARTIDATLGFDAEDLHVEELPDNEAHAAERALIESVECAYIPRCDLLTAASPGIADQIARRYAVSRPLVIYNLFTAPGAAANTAAATAPRRRDGLSLYWYSQVIGPARGLEDAVRALALLDRPGTLWLRGEADAAYVAKLKALARELGVDERVEILPPAPADDLVALAAEHDVGLALEVPDTLNRALCVTNKVFTYLAAGVAIAATDTLGQRAVLEQCGRAAILYPPGDASALAAALRLWIDEPARLEEAKRSAARAAAEQFPWEPTAAAFVDHVERGAEAHGVRSDRQRRSHVRRRRQVRGGNVGSAATEAE